MIAFQRGLMRLLPLLIIILFSLIPQCWAVEFLHVSYDPTRELYHDINLTFAKRWKEETGETLLVRQSHGGSGKQARSVIDGLQADMVSLALAYDIDVIAERTSLLSQNWEGRFPHRNTPYHSTIVFLVRKGNPKRIYDWSDLVRDNVEVITPNPKTSGGARWNYLAAWGYALQHADKNEVKAKNYMKKLFANVPLLDISARGSSISFVRRGIGDVLISWENEAFLAMKHLGHDKLEMVVPKRSILAEPPVAIIDKNAEKHGVTNVVKAYISYLYSDEGQHKMARHFFRPVNSTILKQYPDRFETVSLFTVADLGGWKELQKEHFDDGGIFDQIYGY